MIPQRFIGGECVEPWVLWTTSAAPRHPIIYHHMIRIMNPSNKRLLEFMCFGVAKKQDSVMFIWFYNKGLNGMSPTSDKHFPWSMMTSSNGKVFCVTGPLCGEFTGPGEFPSQRPVTRSFDVFFDLRLNKRLSKQPWDWGFDTPVWSLWRHRNAVPCQFYYQYIKIRTL